MNCSTSCGPSAPSRCSSPPYPSKAAIAWPATGYNHTDDEYFLLDYTEIPVHFPGTGDIFSAVLIGHLLNGDKLKAACRKAMDAVYQLIDLNKDNADKNRGIPLERYLDIL